MSPRQRLVFENRYLLKITIYRRLSDYSKKEEAVIRYEEINIL